MTAGTGAARLEVRPGRALSGRFQPPGDKSVTHRALLAGLLARGTSRIAGANPGADAGSTLACCEALGARVGRDADGTLVIEGRDFALAEPAGVLDCGNSGTTLRLLAGVLAAQPFVSVLAGDASLHRRPVGRVVEPLRRMGASLWARAGDTLPPLSIRGARLAGIDHALPVASAQVASCVLLAGLFAEGATTVRIPGPARDHTERLLAGRGVALDVAPEEGGGRTVTLRGPARFAACDVRVPGDVSAAAFHLAGAAAMPGARVTAVGVGLNPTRTGLLDALEAMGARVTIEHRRDDGGEPAGDVTVEGPERLRAIDLPREWLPRMIDEVPAWAVAAALADGTSRLRDAAELRVKESDRIAAVCDGLVALGVRAAAHGDGFDVTGGRPRAGRVDADGDHRIAMAFAVLGAAAGVAVTIDGAGGIATSDPAFAATLASLGADVAGAGSRA